MTEELKQIANEQIALLPREVQDAINSVDWGSIVAEVGKKNMLTEEEINSLQTETLLVLVGIQSWNSFPVNIEDEVGTSRDEADRIATEIDQRIFTPLYDKVVENVKKNNRDKNANWKQSVDFILSGGDYTSLIERRSGREEKEAPVYHGGGGFGHINDLKDKFTI